MSHTHEPPAKQIIEIHYWQHKLYEAVREGFKFK